MLRRHPQELHRSHFALFVHVKISFASAGLSLLDGLRLMQSENEFLGSVLGEHSDIHLQFKAVTDAGAEPPSSQGADWGDKARWAVSINEFVH